MSGWLGLSETEIDTVEPLHSVRGITCLEPQNSRLSDLYGNVAHVSLLKLDVSHTAATDLTALIKLKGPINSKDMDADVFVFADMLNLTITYQSRKVEKRQGYAGRIPFFVFFLLKFNYVQYHACTCINIVWRNGL